MSKNIYVEKYRRKRSLKRMFLVLILLMGILLALALNLPIFNVETFIIKNNSVISTEKIEKDSGLVKGVNIFYTSLKDARTNILNNPYILEVDIKRRIPNALLITVEERKAMFYINYSGEYYIIDLNGVVLEKRTSLKDITLPRLEGIELKEVPKLGTTIDFGSERKIKLVKDLFSLIDNAKSNLPIKSINIAKEYDFKITYNNLEIILGNEEDLKDKLNAAINIIKELKYSQKKGYIDVSIIEEPAINITDTSE